MARQNLPSALEDRLSASQVLLRGLTEADAAEMLRLRLEQTDLSPDQRDDFTRFVSVNRHFLGRPIGSVSARAFLRHCARQWEIFQSSPPASGEMPGSAPTMPDFSGGVEVDVLPALEKDSGGEVPLMTETLRLAADDAIPVSLPVLFDDQTASDVQTMAESLTEPRPALPQDEIFIDTAPPEILEEPETPAEPVSVYLRAKMTNH